MRRRDAFTNERLFVTDVGLDQFGPPEIVDIEPIHTCNFRCVMCHVSQERLTHTAIDVEALRRSIASLPLRDRWAVVGATHEPTMHPQFDEIIAILTEAGMKIDLTTNGSLFTDKLIDKIRGGNFARVTISFDGATAETYEKIRRRANFQRTVDHVLAFKEAIGNANTYYTLNYTMTKSNVDEIDDAVDMWEDYSFDHISFIAMVLRSDAPEAVAERLDNVQDDVKATLLGAARRIIETPLRITASSSVFNGSDLGKLYPKNVIGNLIVSDHPDAVHAANCRPYFQEGYYPDVPVGCRSPYKHVRIAFDGEVRLCFDKFGVGNINRQMLSDIWYGGGSVGVRQSIKADHAICQHCDFFKFCIHASSIDTDDKKNWVSEDLRQKLSLIHI